MSNEKNKPRAVYPGITIVCKSGRFIAFYDHRTDIIANGENEKDALKNLKELYKIVNDLEEKEEEERRRVVIPDSFKASKFNAKIC